MSNADLCASLWYNYNLCHLLSSTRRLSLFCAAPASRRWNLRGRKEPVSRGQKAFQSDKNLCQHFLPGSERPAFRAVSLFLRGEPGFNGTTLPLHLPARILQTTAAYMWASDCHSAYLSAACELHTPFNSWQKLFVFRHTLEKLNRLQTECVWMTQC